MTKEDWQKVKDALSGTWGHADLQIDGYRISLHRELVSSNRLGIIVYVNGYVKGIWLGEKNDHPEQRFLYPKERYCYSAKFRAGMKKVSRKTRRTLGCEDFDKKYVCYRVHWPTVDHVRRYYEKTFESIELLETIG